MIIMKKITNFKPPFEVGEYKDITIRVYLPKDTEEHLGDKSTIAKVISRRLNELYAKLVMLPHWNSSQLWFEPVIHDKTTQIEYSLKESWLND